MASGATKKHQDEDRLEAQNYSRAILNILADSAEEKIWLGDTQRAILNILDDSDREKTLLESTQKAVLNILEDSSEEKTRLGDAQRAMVNILDDFNLEKEKVAQFNVKLVSEIAERKRTEEEIEAANKELEAFAYSVSHDLRVPLRAIDGFSLILTEDYSDKLDDEGKRLIKVVRENTKKMSQLIDDLLVFSRTGRKELTMAEVDMAGLVTKILEEIMPADRTVNMEIKALPPVYGDMAMLRQAMTNLISNALKFTRPRREAVIEIGSRVDGDGIVYYVKDNGAGFDMKYVQKLFGVFQRLHSQNEFEGTGVGLAIVQRIIHRHGGKIWAESRIGEGASFYFTLKQKK